MDNCPLPHHPKQREFARLNVTHTVMSKRYLRQLVFEKHVEGWDDPRMPTLCALRRRGYTPSAILDFVQRAGVAKADSLVDIKLLEHCIREELNDTALRRMAVTEPVRLTITNYPATSARNSRFRTIRAMKRPARASAVHTRVVYRKKRLCRGAASEVPAPQAGRRGSPDGRVHRPAATRSIKDENGEIVEIRCTGRP